MPYYPEETVDEISLANVINSASYDAITGVVGKLALSCLHATAITAAAGPVGTVAMACGVGGAILCLPYACIRTCLDALEPTNSLSIEYLAYEASIFLLNTTTAFYAGAIGAAVLGAAPAPIALCALAGAILLNGLTLIDLMIRIPIVITVGLYSLITTPVIELLGDVLGAIGSVLQMVTPSCMTSQRDGQFPNVIPSAPPMPVAQAYPVKENDSYGNNIVRTAYPYDPTIPITEIPESGYAITIPPR